jgi:transcriptional regulator with XRE-family HTH domain
MSAACTQNEPSNHVDQHVGGRIQLRRREVGMSQRELARILRVSSRTLRAYERGEKRPSARHISAIADALSIPVSFFFSEFEQDQKPSLDAVQR